uniref:histidine--tRNA ligase n=1 Tax=Calcidiscus leptoporus TaxID=127549 RepID=A0A7S0P618_9EUKA
MVWEGEGAVAAALEVAGDEDPSKAARGTIRAELAHNVEANLVDVSPTAAEAARQLRVWFDADDVVSEGSSRPAVSEGSETRGGETNLPPARAAAPASATSPAAAIEQAVAVEAREGASKSKAQLKKEAKKAEKAAKKEAHKAGVAPPSESKPAVSLDPPSGTRDFFPDEMRLRSWLFGRFRETARQLAFVEYDAPVLEHEELYKRKGGEEITEQMYNFVDKDGKAVALRPEMTPTLARMILSLGGKQLLPVKWFSIPQCWRFETVQRGRKREHFQWNMDIIGEPSIAAEVELLSAVTTFFKSVGISADDVGIKVNSRKVLSATLKLYGITDDTKFAEVCVIVDKLDKIGAEPVVELLMAKDVGEEAARKIVASLSLRSVAQLEELIGDASSEAVRDMTELFKQAEAYGFADFLVFDASVVRGLAYYTGIVFEGFDRKGELRAICGGGRYDELLTLYDPSLPADVPACGFGFGDCVLMELLHDKGLLPQLEPQIDFVVVAYNAEMKYHALSIVSRLRQALYAVDLLLEPAKKVAKAFSYADRVHGKRVLFVAPDEWSAGKVRMKDLRTQDEALKEVDLPVETLVDELRQMGIMPSGF